MTHASLNRRKFHVYCRTDGVNVGKLALPSERLGIAMYIFLYWPAPQLDNDDNTMSYFIRKMTARPSWESLLLRQIGV
jgi:hypothetical protein